MSIKTQILDGYLSYKSHLFWQHLLLDELARFNKNYQIRKQVVPLGITVTLLGSLRQPHKLSLCTGRLCDAF